MPVYVVKATTYISNNDDNPSDFRVTSDDLKSMEMESKS